MDGQDGFGYGSDQRTYTVNRRTEMVSGKGGSNQIYRSPPARRSNASSVRPSWGLNDAEMKRKKRIARYKAYTVEAKVKSSLKNGYRWIRNKCCQIVHRF
uniref:DUF3511 domain protein n=1 Tax=Noccaea caerulescens TaxID=107243 RepID=A0A1J3D9Y0_NOCCA